VSGSCHDTHAGEMSCHVSAVCNEKVKKHLLWIFKSESDLVPSISCLMLAPRSSCIVMMGWVIPSSVRIAFIAFVKLASLRRGTSKST
jgi:hypothetical protein